jgi:signal peptidase I
VQPVVKRLWRRAALTAGFLAALSACSPSTDFDVMMQDSAMEPTYSARQVIRFRPSESAERGQIIAFEYPFTYPGRPRRELIARVIGLPGDRLELGPDGVRVNGAALSEPYAKNQREMTAAQVTVPPGTYFVLGDDRHNQRDSRWWGPLPMTKLLGLAVDQS